jgi:hypothetical protein
MFTKKLLSTLLLSIALLSASSAYADGCKDIVGSFIGQRGSTPDDALLDQFTFHEDGTVYWNQSNALVFPLTTGTSLPEVGTWEIQDDHLVITTIGVAAAPDRNDLNISNYHRDTQEFKIKDCNTLEVLHRVFRRIPLDEDPLTADGTIALDSTLHFDLKRVKVRTSDLDTDFRQPSNKMDRRSRPE